MIKKTDKKKEVEETRDSEDIDVKNDSEQTEATEIKDEKVDVDGDIDKGKKVEEEMTEVEALKEEIAERKEKFLRLYAEFENYKKRMLREKVELRLTAARDTIKRLLPVLDDFKRAKAISEDKESGEVFTEGVQLVYEKIKSALKEAGLIEMESNGEKFDSDLHDAFAELPVTDKDKKGIIIDTIETGYYLNDKILRHAKVVVGK